MAYGYSLRLFQLNSVADSNNLGVRLGKLCIDKSISVIKVSADLRVSRQTVYNWFCGVTAPQPLTVQSVVRYINMLERD
jgi:N-acetyl-gamma-glutamylphosphate reductase